jgi:hypothetical protein
VPQQERLPIMRPELGQRPGDFLAPFDGGGRIGGGGEVVAQFFAEAAAVEEPPLRGSASVDQNGEEPCPETIRLPAVPERTVGPNEAVLHGLLSVLPAAQHMERIPAQGVPIPAHERREGTQVAAQRTSDQDGIALAHRG